MELSNSQRERIKRAREVLDNRPEWAGDNTDVIMALSTEIGRLRFWLDDVLDLVGQLAPAAAADSTRSAADSARFAADGTTLLSALDAEDQDDEDMQAYCSECGATIGHFIGRAGWLHFRGQGTAEHPNEIFAAGHVPAVAWRPASTTAGEV